MDTLHSVLRAIRGDAKPRRDHLTVFREFLAHLDRAAKRSAPRRSVKATKPGGRRAKKS
jgi:hypothetical protein